MRVVCRFLEGYPDSCTIPSGVSDGSRGTEVASNTVPNVRFRDSAGQAQQQPSGIERLAGVVWSIPGHRAC